MQFCNMYLLEGVYMGDITNNNDRVSSVNIVKVFFYYSKSKLYNRALKIAKTFPVFDNQERAVCCAINDIYDFCRLQKALHELITIVAKWKSSKIWFYGKQYKTKSDYYTFLRQVEKKAGKYAPTINKPESKVALGNIAIEDLPYPIVYYPNHYGAFFAFAKDIDEPIVFCECERTAIENYIKLRKKKPLKGYVGDKTNPLGSDNFNTIVSRISKETAEPLSKFEFKKGICFRCNKVVPSYSYCLPMYGGSFKQHYGWYIQQEYFKLGIEASLLRGVNVLEDFCDPEIYDSLKRLSVLQQHSPEAKEIKKQIDQTIENSVRIQLGFRKIGDAWISETILYEIVCQIFEGDDIIRHYRPDWLYGLELDIYIPNRNIAFEYQGIQHFCAVKHWGGEKQLQKQKEHDARKKRICSQRRINLICINYNDPLTTEFVSSCIND